MVLRTIRGEPKNKRRYVSTSFYSLSFPDDAEPLTARSAVIRSRGEVRRKLPGLCFFVLADAAVRGIFPASLRAAQCKFRVISQNHAETLRAFGRGHRRAHCPSEEQGSVGTLPSLP